MTIFFSSDRHFDHENIIKFCNRPFTSLEDMNEAMIERHNKVVKPNDEFYDLGDFMFGISPRRMAEVLSRLNGHKTIILGNHDNADYFREVYKFGVNPKLRTIHSRILELKGKAWGGYMPTLCHYPMLSWNGSFHGSFQLHGHTHGHIPFNPNIRRLDVGVDSHNFTPISWEEIVVKLKDIPSPKQQKALEDAEKELINGNTKD